MPVDDPNSDRRWATFIAALGVPYGIYLLFAAIGAMGVGHGGVFSPMLFGVIVFASILCSCAAVARGDFSSLRNWLILAALASGVNLWWLIQRDHVLDRWPGFLLPWAILLFAWQLPAWGLWTYFRTNRSSIDPGSRSN